LICWLVRHAHAGDPHEWQESGRPDDLRPLTEKGRRRSRKLFRKLAPRLRGLDLLVASPILRAEQTAEIFLEGSARKLPLNLSSMLRHEADPEEVFILIGLLSSAYRSVMFVGHEPHLTKLLQLCVGEAWSFGEMKKSGICALRWEEDGPHLVAYWTPKLGRAV
jgi:phosphohistidine phosphatase